MYIHIHKFIHKYICIMEDKIECNFLIPRAELIFNSLANFIYTCFIAAPFVNNICFYFVFLSIIYIFVNNYLFSIKYCKYLHC